MILMGGTAEIQNPPQGSVKYTQSRCFLPSPSDSSRTAVLKLDGKIWVNFDLHPAGFSFSVFLCNWIKIRSFQK